MTKESKPEETIKNIKTDIIQTFTEKLKSIKEEESEEIYFQDIISEVIDRHCPADRKTCLEIIDYTDMEQHIDEGVIDTSNIDRTLITTAYECLRTFLFEDEFMMYLQEQLNNEELNNSAAVELINKLDKYSKENNFGKVGFEDSSVQTFLELSFNPVVEDFKSPYFAKSQVLNLCNNTIKVFTNNKEQNRNALVIELVQKDGTYSINGQNKVLYSGNPLYRVYLMQKDKDLNMLELIKKHTRTPCIAENNYSLLASDYMKGKKKDVYNKKEFIYLINQIAAELVSVKWELQLLK